MIDAKNCPYHNIDWYDVTDIDSCRKGYVIKVCIRIDCKNKCTHILKEKYL